ncbi:MAG: glycoside hydrolase family 2, partial [Sphingobacteriaceae bacterium]
MSFELNRPNYGSSVLSRGETDTLDSINPLPRAVIRPNSFTLLDGEWKFELDRDDRGLQENWQTSHDYEDTAHWPGSVEQQMAKEEPAEQTWENKIVVWYEREFERPVQSNGPGMPPSIIQLTFGACGYETQVWLNGLPLQTIEGELVHVGEYTSFSYELDDADLKDVNRLTVRIADTKDADTTRGKQESSVYKRGGIWYQTYTGAVRSIWLESVERNRLRSRVGVVSMVEEKMVRLNLTTRIHDPGAYTIKLQVFNKHPDQAEPIATDEYPLHLDAGQKEQRVVMHIPDAKLWSPELPTRYRLVAQLIDPNGYIAEIETSFGLRKIESRGCCIYLNDKAVYLDGILYQPGGATYEEIKQHMHAMKALGCNLVRIHIAGVDPRIYNLADKLGLLLWVEVPSPHSSNAKSRANHRAELLRMLA